MDYESLAEIFYKETGLMAPGKDPGYLSNQPSFEIRFKAWENWIFERAKDKIYRGEKDNLQGGEQWYKVVNNCY